MSHRSVARDLSRSDTNRVPAGAPVWVTSELIDHTLRVWQPYYAEPLTADDALAIIQNISQLIEVVSREPSP